MSSPSKHIYGDVSLPDPTGSYQLIVFSQNPRRGPNPPNWLEWKDYFAQMSLALAGTNCTVICNAQTVSTPYAQGSSPSVGVLQQFSVTLNSVNCAFSLSVYNPPGPGLRIQGSVTIALAAGPQTLEVRLLRTPIAVPAGSFAVSSDTNAALAGTLTITSATAGAYQQTGQSSQPVTLTWNSNGTPNQPTLAFGASVVPAAGPPAVPYTFSALFDPNWDGTKLLRKFHGTATALGPGAGGGGTDWTAESGD